MAKIRIQNGYTFDSLTGDVKNKDKNYFIDLFYAIEKLNK